MTTERPASHAATNSSRVLKHEPVVGWAPNHNSWISEKVSPQLSMSLLAVARGTLSLPHQTLKQEMPRLGLAGTHAGKVRAANPGPFEANGVRSDSTVLDRIGQVAQALPAKTLEDASLRSTAALRHRRADESG